MLTRQKSINVWGRWWSVHTHAKPPFLRYVYFSADYPAEIGTNKAVKYQNYQEALKENAKNKCGSLSEEKKKKQKELMEGIDTEAWRNKKSKWKERQRNYQVAKK